MDTYHVLINDQVKFSAPNEASAMSWADEFMAGLGTSEVGDYDVRVMSAACALHLS